MLMASWLPYRDIRCIFYSYLDEHDQNMMEIASGTREIESKDIFTAIKLGYLEQVQYFYKIGQWNAHRLLEHAIYNKQEAIAIWLCSINISFRVRQSQLLEISIKEQTTLLTRYMIESLHWSWYFNALPDIVCEGDLELAQWAVDYGYDWEKTYDYMIGMSLRFVTPERFRWLQSLGGFIRPLYLQLATEKWN